MDLHAKTEQAVRIDCALSECTATFPARKGKKYCSMTCRVKASDLRKIDRVRDFLESENLDEKDVKRIARILGKKLSADKKKKPFRMNKSHRDLLAWIDNRPTQNFVPAWDHHESNVMISWQRRARELRAEGILVSYKVYGGTVVFLRPSAKGGPYIITGSRTITEEVGPDSRIINLAKMLPPIPEKKDV